MRNSDDKLDVFIVPVDALEPNPWNPNEMDEATFQAEVASIQEFGFIVPVIARSVGKKRWQIIDGFHRWKAGKSLGYTELPIVQIDVDDDEAKELTIILNETRGRANPEKLAVLVRDLATRRERSRLDDILPFDRSHLDQMLTTRRDIDWSELDKRRANLGNEVRNDGEESEKWVEKTYRMPAAAALVIEEAIERVKEEEGVDQGWRALEMIAADFLAT